MIFHSALDHLKIHYNLDELIAEPDFNTGHTSPDRKHTEFEYKVFARKGDIRFRFMVPVNWQAHVTEIPWWEIHARIMHGSEVTTYTIDHQQTSEYVINMILTGLEAEPEEKDDGYE